MKKTAISILEFFLNLLLANLEGWYIIFVSIYNRLWRAYQRIPALDQVFLGISLLGFILAFLPWIEYSIALPERETIRISSGFKFFYLIPGVLGPLFYFFDFKFARLSFLIPSSLILVLYLLGFPFPELAHTRMMERSDYHFLPWLYLYGPVLLGQLVLSYRSTENDVFKPFNYIRSEERLMGKEKMAIPEPVPQSEPVGQKVSSETRS